MTSDNGRTYQNGITHWFNAEDALQGYFVHVAEQRFPYDNKKARQLVDCMGQAFLPVLAKTARIENHKKRTTRYLSGLEKWKDLAVEFLHTGYEMTSFMNRIERELREALGFEGDLKKQLYSFDVVMDWLVEAVDQQKSWLFNRDKMGRIDLFNHAKQNGPALLRIAEGDFKGFRMAGFVRGLDYETPNLQGTIPLTKDALHFVKIKSIDALKKAGEDLQNCIRHKPRDNELRIDYEALLRSGNVDFIALCGAQGNMHGLMTVQNGVIQEVGGKQGVLPDKKYMGLIVDFARKNGLDINERVSRTGIVKTATGLASYLDLVDPNRKTLLHIEGNLNLNDLREVFNIHAVPFVLQNIQVDGHLLLHHTYTRALKNVSAKTIALVGSAHIDELDTSVSARLLLTDCEPANLKLHALMPYGRTNIEMVNICDALKLGETEYKVVQQMTGEAFAELYSGNNAFMRDYRAKMKAARMTIDVVFEDITFRPGLN